MPEKNRKESTRMAQQQIHFDPDNRDGPPSYETGYQENVHDNDYSSHVTGEKLSRRDALMHPTAGQRLALAIISLLVLLLMFLAVILLAASGVLAPNEAQHFVPTFVYMILGLFAAVIVVNVLFNRRH
jgi:hypothetical protein